jgi:hypothetical protein
MSSSPTSHWLSVANVMVSDQLVASDGKTLGASDGTLLETTDGVGRDGAGDVRWKHPTFLVIVNVGRRRHWERTRKRDRNQRHIVRRQGGWIAVATDRGNDRTATGKLAVARRLGQPLGGPMHCQSKAETIAVVAKWSSNLLVLEQVPSRGGQGLFLVNAIYYQGKCKWQFFILYLAAFSNYYCRSFVAFHVGTNLTNGLFLSHITTW